MAEEKEYDYTTVSLPTPLADEIDKIIAEFPGLGYRTKAEFVKQAVRNEISRIRKQ